jgi:hypothetical protein
MFFAACSAGSNSSFCALSVWPAWLNYPGEVGFDNGVQSGAKNGENKPTTERGI